MIKWQQTPQSKQNLGQGRIREMTTVTSAAQIHQIKLQVDFLMVINTYSFLQVVIMV